MRSMPPQTEVNPFHASLQFGYCNATALDENYLAKYSTVRITKCVHEDPSSRSTGHVLLTYIHCPDIHVAQDRSGRD